MRWGLLALALLGRAAVGSEAALVIGSDVGLPGEPRLEYAEADARRVHALLTEVGLVGAGRAQLLTGVGADEVRGALRELRRAPPLKTLVVYVSAHADVEGLHLRGTRLPLRELRAALRESGAALVLGILDTCRTPIATRGGRPKLEEPPVVQVQPTGAATGVVLLMAARVGEPAQEWSSLRGALFTHHLAGALRGLADTDGDGAITLGEAYAYAYRRTLASSVLSTSGAQHPSFEAELQGYGEWVLARPGERAATLAVSGELDGSLWISDARGMVAEVSKNRGEVARVSLPAGRYRVVRPHGRSADAADVVVGERGEHVLSPAAFARVPLERALERGSPVRQRSLELTGGYRLESPTLLGARASHFGELGLRWSARGLFAGGGLGVSAGGFRFDGFAVRMQQLKVSGVAGATFWLWPIEARLGVELAAAWVSQQVERLDDGQVEEVFGVKEPPRGDVVLGASAVAGALVPLVEPLRLGVDLGAGAARMPAWDGAAYGSVHVFARASLAWGL